MEQFQQLLEWNQEAARGQFGAMEIQISSLVLQVQSSNDDLSKKIMEALEAAHNPIDKGKGIVSDEASPISTQSPYIVPLGSSPQATDLQPLLPYIPFGYVVNLEGTSGERAQSIEVPVKMSHPISAPYFTQPPVYTSTEPHFRSTRTTSPLGYPPGFPPSSIAIPLHSIPLTQSKPYSVYPGFSGAYSSQPSFIPLQTTAPMFTSQFATPMFSNVNQNTMGPGMMPAFPWISNLIGAIINYLL